MHARLYQSGDAEVLDGILGHPQQGDVRLDRDRLVVLGVPGRPMGLLAWRLSAFVHELRVGNGLGQKRRADLLVDFATDDAMRFGVCEAIFVTDSDSMARYALNRGGVEQFGKRVITLRVK